MAIVASAFAAAAKEGALGRALAYSTSENRAKITGMHAGLDDFERAILLAFDQSSQTDPALRVRPGPAASQRWPCSAPVSAPSQAMNVGTCGRCAGSQASAHPSQQLDQSPTKPVLIVVQEQARSYCDRLRGMPDVWQLCMHRFAASSFAEVQFWCLQTLQQVASSASVPLAWQCMA